MFVVTAIFVVFLLFLSYKGCDYLKKGHQESAVEETVDDGNLYPESDGVDESDYSIDEDFERPRDSDDSPAVREDADVEFQEEGGKGTVAQQDKVAEQPIVPRAYDETVRVDVEDAPAAVGTDGYQYLVIAGSFASEANAKAEVSRLDKKGIEAEVVHFDRSSFYSVSAGKFNEEAPANAQAKTLRSAGVDAYVHKKRTAR